MNGEEHTLYFHKPNKFLLFFFWATAWGFRNYVLSERPSLFQVKKKNQPFFSFIGSYVFKFLDCNDSFGEASISTDTTMHTFPWSIRRFVRTNANVFRIVFK